VLPCGSIISQKMLFVWVCVKFALFCAKISFYFGFVMGWAAFSAPMGEEFFTIYAIYLHSIRNIVFLHVGEFLVQRDFNREYA
jgi:hypothetical protein